MTRRPVVTDGDDAAKPLPHWRVARSSQATGELGRPLGAKPFCIPCQFDRGECAAPKTCQSRRRSK